MPYQCFDNSQPKPLLFFPLLFSITISLVCWFHSLRISTQKKIYMGHIVEPFFWETSMLFSIMVYNFTLFLFNYYYYYLYCYCTGGTLWHLQKFLQYFIVEFTPSSFSFIQFYILAKSLWEFHLCYIFVCISYFCSSHSN
jgi:hypothetical protein